MKSGSKILDGFAIGKIVPEVPSTQSVECSDYGAGAERGEALNFLDFVAASSFEEETSVCGFLWGFRHRTHRTQHSLRGKSNYLNLSAFEFKCFVRAFIINCLIKETIVYLIK